MVGLKSFYYVFYGHIKLYFIIGGGDGGGGGEAAAVPISSTQLDLLPLLPVLLSHPLMYRYYHAGNSRG